MKAQQKFWTVMVIMLIGASAYAAQPAAMPACIAKHFPNQSIQTQSIKIKAPELAEEGGKIPVGIESIKGIHSTAYVTDLKFFNQYNADPVAQFHFAAPTDITRLRTYMRMRDSGKMYAVAKLSNGQLVSGEAHIKVTIGGCGGGADEAPEPGKIVC